MQEALYTTILGSLGCYNKIPALEVGGGEGPRSGASRFDVR